MGDVCDVENTADEPTTPHDGNTSRPIAKTVPAGDDLDSVVRVEANFLRLPLFALDTKHLRTMEGIHCEGTLRREGQNVAFSYTVTRNTATLYPGPLARAAHFALLSLATDSGLPVQNPVLFSWRELCARMRIQPSGWTMRELRSALTATKGLMIESRHALFSKPDNASLDTGSEERTQIINLYDEVEFVGTKRPDGTMADVNAVFLSRWYVENLNALYSGPLDYTLWRSLNDKSLIASRLYEFLFLKFYGGREMLRFNYATLVKFIPVRTERYLSDAKKQLQPAFALLIEAGILKKVQWIESVAGSPQILLHRGPLLDPAVNAENPYEVGEEDFVLDRIEDVRGPEWHLVTAFHEAWGHSGFRPAKAELELAASLLATHGAETMKELLPRVVKRLKMKWSDAKTFVAVSRYLPEVLAEWQREKMRVERDHAEESKRDADKQRALRQAQDKAVLQAVWQSLSAEEQEDIRQAVTARQPKSAAKFPRIIEGLCLDELGRRKGLAMESMPTAERAD